MKYLIIFLLLLTLFSIDIAVYLYIQNRKLTTYNNDANKTIIQAAKTCSANRSSTTIY